jgi:hypothetical protein
MTSKRRAERDWNTEFRVIEAHAMGPTSERVSREPVTEDNRGFDSPPVWPPAK